MATDKLSAVFVGGGPLLIQCAERFLERGHRIAEILSDDAGVARWAERGGIRFAGLDGAEVERLRTESFDYLFSIVHLALLPEKLTAMPRRGAINYHDGLLPEYAGLNTPSWALLNGERWHGVSWHLMTSCPDAGDVVKQAKFPISETDTALTLNAKCHDAALATFVDLLDDLVQGGCVPCKQDMKRRRYFGRHDRPPAACIIDCGEPAENISALVRSLQFGPYRNDLGAPKLWLGPCFVTMRRANVLSSRSGRPPGTVIAASQETLTLATAGGDLRLEEFAALSGDAIAIGSLCEQIGIAGGDRLPTLPDRDRRTITGLDRSVARYESYWTRCLAEFEGIELGRPGRSEVDRGDRRHVAMDFPTPHAFDPAIGTAGDVLMAAFLLLLARIGGKRPFGVAFRDANASGQEERVAQLYASRVPLLVDWDSSWSFPEFATEIRARLGQVRERGTFALDVLSRQPVLAALPSPWRSGSYGVVVERVRQASDHADERNMDADLLAIIPDDGKSCIWLYREDALGDRIAGLREQFLAMLAALPDASVPVGKVPIMPSAEREKLLTEWSSDEPVVLPRRSVQAEFEAQVVRTPLAPALLSGERLVSFAELNERANRLSHYLLEQGLGRGSLVGIMLDRSIDLVVSMLAVLKAGAAYVPLDPAYPAERLHHMISDAEPAAVIVAGGDASGAIPSAQKIVRMLEIERDLVNYPSGNPHLASSATDLAYVIYTSGSTGRPKGVMVEHGNVINLFAGMNAKIALDPPGVWLAVTSISFDISVVELLWTLCRGFKVVLLDDEQSSPEEIIANNGAATQFSLFYFASDERDQGPDKYRLLLEGSRFADGHDFTAVWVPERHFHAFGGLFPNPAVTAAAIAAITRKVRIRAGSCVLPLHNPIRIAEEWAVVDNLSRGRVDISFASGWLPDDFVIAPENYADRHRLLESGIDSVRALWRGEALDMPGPSGRVSVRTLPRPVQLELPVWVTAAGNPETFEKAAQLGANVLTHLLGQSVGDLAEKIALYRSAWRQHGHAGDGHVTLMLHTFVGQDEGLVREQVWAPLKRYLKSATNLIKQHATTFPAFRRGGEGASDLDRRFASLSAADMDALLEHATARFYETNGLFGTQDRCLEMVRRLRECGVDEIACLIDFGIDPQTVLDSLPQLDAIRVHSSAPNPRPSRTARNSIPRLLRGEHVTHLQCTPSLLSALLRDPRSREALKGLKCILVGGEPFPASLARDLRKACTGRIFNMYGPTETTIWSCMHEVDTAPSDGTVPIGRPIANTRVYIVDDRLEPVPVGITGELLIGGMGLSRGYLGRPDLTSERFIADPFVPGARLYRTGDLVRWRQDGALQFVGRRDTQIKLRGQRIELGEIESVLSQYPAVDRCVVTVREDVLDEKRLIAYLTAKHGSHAKASELRQFLSRTLPEAMVPSAFVVLEDFPTLPNGKINLHALPQPTSARPELRMDYVAPRNSTEQDLASMWAELLRIDDVGVHDSFFELGGDSLTAVELMLRIQQKFAVELPLYRLFEAATIAEIAQFLGR
jgi:natural product biosynthesis luciferase-like monooxygenase protein